MKAPSAYNVTIKKRQAVKLSKLSGVAQKELRRKKLSTIAEKYKLLIDPTLFFMQKVCGQVVKKDPISGDELPVPFATVHVEDTDCHLLAVYPLGSMWGWFYPLFCRREEITSVTTDICGRFCVWIPRFEIDWILKWRLKWLCYPDIFLKPSVKDLLELAILPKDLPPLYTKPPFPPLPDPVWFFKNRALVANRLQQLCGPEIADQYARIDEHAAIGGEMDQLAHVLEVPAFRERTVPPLTTRLLNDLERELESTAEFKKYKSRFNPHIDPSKFIGPFMRCRLVAMPEFVKLFDVPDVTFRVTQDVDSDGTEETIYSEGFFDVRWDASPIPDVKLYADEIAVAGMTCGVPTVPSGDPGIEFAGLHPLVNPLDPKEAYHDQLKGYAQRPNRPRSGGLFSSPHSTDPTTGVELPDAEAPFTKTLQLYGRNEAPGAKYYRILYEYNGSTVPFMHTWQLYRIVSGVLEKKNVAPDTNGWYPIIPKTENWHPQNLLMNWPTGSYGLYKLTLELGDASKNSIALTPETRITVDNTAPDGDFIGLRWREAGASTWNMFPTLICPVIERTVGKNLEIEVTFKAWGPHLRSVILSSFGCGAGTLSLIPSCGPDTAEHWHTSVSDNYYDNSASPAIYSFPSTALPGAYRFQLRIDGRSFNPAGSDGFDADWWYDGVWRKRYRQLQVAIVNA